MDHEQALARLEEQMAKLDARMNRIKARTSIAKRKADTRRKILIGGIVLALIKGGELDEAWLQKWADKMLAHPKDRELFGLPPAAKEKTQGEKF